MRSYKYRLHPNASHTGTTRRKRACRNGAGRPRLIRYQGIELNVAAIIHRQQAAAGQVIGEGTSCDRTGLQCQRGGAVDIKTRATRIYGLAAEDGLQY